MAKTIHTLAALLLVAGFGFATAQSALAQPKEGCGVDVDHAAMEGSEVGSGAPQPHVGDPDMAGAEEHAAMEGSTQGSGAPMPGRGECDDIDELPQAKTEG